MFWEVKAGGQPKNMFFGRYRRAASQKTCFFEGGWRRGGASVGEDLRKEAPPALKNMFSSEKTCFLKDHLQERLVKLIVLTQSSSQMIKDVCDRSCFGARGSSCHLRTLVHHKSGVQVTLQRFV